MENKFFTAEPKMINVSEAEFYKFINDYPRRLARDVCAICEPPVITYNDFDLANRWPYSIVARTVMADNDEEDCPYMVMKNFEEVFNSKTGYIAKGEDE